MPAALLILLALILVIMLWQDFTQRAIYWYWFPAAAYCAVLYALYMQNMLTWLAGLGINILFLLLQWAVITLYFSFKHRSWIHVLDRYIGMGDVLFLLCAALFFSPVWFLLFFLSGLILSVLSAIPLHFLPSENKKYIPLAGIMAGLQALCILFALLTPVCFYEDEYLLTFFLR